MAAIEKTNVGAGTPLAAAFDFNAAKPLDSRLTVPAYDGLAALTGAGAAYPGMRVYVETGDKQGNYQFVDGNWVSETEELKALIGAVATAAMEFKGTIANGILPTTGDKGDMYKIVTENLILAAADNAEGQDAIAKPGDSIVNNGDGKWYLIPSGDDMDDTWRPVKAGGNTLSDTETLEFIAGENVTITEEAGKVTIAAEDTHYESKLVVADSATEHTDEAVAENGNVYLNLIEDGVVKSAHKIVGAGGISVTHAMTEEDGNVITIEAAEGAKYDLAAKTENGKATLSLAGTDNTEDKVTFVGGGEATVTASGNEITISVDALAKDGSNADEADFHLETEDFSITADFINLNGGDITLTGTSAKLNGKDIATVDQIPTNHKTKQTAVANKITKKVHVLSSLTQNENGEIDYAVNELTLEDLGGQAEGNYLATDGSNADVEFNLTTDDLSLSASNAANLSGADGVTIGSTNGTVAVTGKNFTFGGKAVALREEVTAVDNKYGAMIQEDENDNIIVGDGATDNVHLNGYYVTLGVTPEDDPYDSTIELNGTTIAKGAVKFEEDPAGNGRVDVNVPAYYNGKEIATKGDIPANKYEGYISAGDLGDGEDILALHAAQRITADAEYIDLTGDVTVNGKALKTAQTAVTNKITDAAHVINSLTQNANGEITYGVKKLTPADIGALKTDGSNAAGNFSIQTLSAQTITINLPDADIDVGMTLEALGDLANKDKVTEADIEGTIASTKISGLGALAAKDTIAEGDITGTIAVGKISGLGALATKSKVAEGDISGTIAHTKISGLGTFATKSELSYNDLNDKPTLGALAAKDTITEAEIEGTIAHTKIEGLGALATKDNITHNLVTDFGTAVKAVKVDAAVDADKLGGVAAADYALKTDVTTAIQALDSNVKATAGSVLTGVTITDGKLTAKEELALHKVATSGSIYDVAEGSHVSTGADGVKYVLFNCGTASTVV